MHWEKLFVVMVMVWWGLVSHILVWDIFDALHWEKLFFAVMVMVNGGGRSAHFGPGHFLPLCNLSAGSISGQSVPVT